jgi:Fe-S-cluster containining protein
MSVERNAVPCNGCRACCINERVILAPEHGDDLGRYCAVPTRLHNDGEVRWMLAHKGNGECWYLGETGCTIHDLAPWACRQFDCRKWYAGFPEAMAELLTVDDLDGRAVAAARTLLGIA